MTPEKLVSELLSKPAHPGGLHAASSPQRNARCCSAPRMPRGPRPTCRCWTRRPNSSASSIPPPAADSPSRSTTAPATWPTPGRRCVNMETAGVDVLMSRRGTRRAEPGARGTADRGRARHQRPHLGVWPHRGRRGAGAVADAVAPPGPALPAEVLHDRGGHRPDQLRGRAPIRGRVRLAPLFGDRWQLEELTVNYRTPSQIAEAAARMANAAGLVVSAPKAVREGRWSPIIDRVDPGSLVSRLVEVLPEELDALDGGLLAVIADGDLLPEATSALPRSLRPPHRHRRRQLRTGRRRHQPQGGQGPGIRRRGGSRAVHDAQP